MFSKQKIYVLSALIAWLLCITPLYAQNCEQGDCKNGKGKLEYSDGSTYIGDFKGGKRNGNGRWIDADGSIYDGHWQNDMRNGQGRWEGADGNIYEGAWKNNARYGDGKQQWADGGLYLGDWYSDHRFGRGVMTYANGNKYNGNWEDGHYEGKGAFEWVTGEQFWGRWSHSLPQDGQLKFKDDKRYKGVWRNHGLKDGNILLQFICNATTIATWHGESIVDTRPEGWRKDNQAESNQKQAQSALAGKGEDVGDGGVETSKQKLPVKTVVNKEEVKEGDFETIAPSEEFLEKYGGDFNMIIRELEAEKQILSEKGIQIRSEMEEIAERLENDNLTTEQKAQLEDYLHTLERALISTELALQNALEMTTIVINRMRTTILQKDTAIKEITVESEKHQSKYRVFAVLLSIAVIGASVLFFLWRKLTRQNAKIEAQKEKIERQSGEIALKSKVMKKQNDNIISSMVYARRIQKALLSHHEVIYDSFHESFILLLPRDIISGDFYWFASIGDKRFIAAVDCTGHGVPGAFMSLVGNDLLNDIVLAKGIHSPEEVLEALHNRVVEGLRQGDSSNAQDGMDISLCVLDIKTNVLEFAGARSPLFIVDNGHIHEVKGDKFPIGGMQKPKESAFVKQILQLHGGETCYIFSDGYRDQFGGKDNRKLMKKGFRQLLLEIQKMHLLAQRDYLREHLNTWKGEQRQLDDILVIGFKVQNHKA